MNCSFNIRYKPRTTRQFTKSDLTVYDSADNTALNALTVYGKSEVVNGAIVSAGEGWNTVRLADLTWTIVNAGATTERFQTLYFYNNHEALTPPNNSTVASMMCNNFITSTASRIANIPNITGGIGMYSNGTIEVRLSSVHTVADFITAISGVILAYELADPTQGNCIAVKTDNGTGINGTMAVFTTGTPLRGIPNSNIRDVMAWDGSAGTVAKVLSDIDLGTLNYTYNTTRQWFQSTDLRQLIKPTPTIEDKGNLLCPIYTTYSIVNMWETSVNDAIGVNEGSTLYIRNNNYTDPAAFKTAMSGVKLIYELAIPTTEQLTSTENASIAGLRTFTPQTHAQNNAGAEMTVDYTIRVPTI